MKILLADDHTVVRRGLQEIIAEEFPGADFGVASSGAEVFHAVHTSAWDVVVLDINLPDCSGLDVLVELHHLYPDTPVLIMTMYPEEQYALRALRAGAMGYLTKDSAPEELVTAIRHLLSGRRFISASFAEQIAGQLAAPRAEKPHELLSNREFQIFNFIVAGLKPSGIAEKLTLSIKTVSTYHTRIFDKMGMKTDSELIYYAIKEGLLDSK